MDSQKMFDPREHYEEIEAYIRENFEPEEVPLPLMEQTICHASLEESYRSLDDVLGEVEETFSEHLIRLSNERNLTNVEIYKRANLRKQHFSKILSNKNYRPKKNK